MKNTIIAFVFSLLASGCSKDDNKQDPEDKLPEATMIGANTAGCIINGKVLIPKNGINSTNGFLTYGLEYVVGPQFSPPTFNDYFCLWIANRKDKNRSLYIHLPTLINRIGNYNIGQSNGDTESDGPQNPYILCYIKNSDNTYKTFYSSNNSGVIKITRFDYQNKIYSGTFSCTLYDKDNPSEIIQITEGRFDINGLTLNQ